MDGGGFTKFLHSRQVPLTPTTLPMHITTLYTQHSLLFGLMCPLTLSYFALRCSRFSRRLTLKSSTLSLSLSQLSLDLQLSVSKAENPREMVYTISGIRFPAVSPLCNRSRSNFTGNRSSNISLLPTKDSFSRKFFSLSLFFNLLCFSSLALIVFLCFFFWLSLRNVLYSFNQKWRSLFCLLI